ncbi:MAG: sigma-70 family RNA polymerase sigma factor [Vicinamibacterales bacterium]
MPDHASEQHDDLIEKIAGGDRDAFALLYRRFRPDVYRFAVHMCGSRAQAEDVVQDVFVVVIEDAERYRPGRSGVLAWLLGIARNHVRRWRYRRPVMPLPGDETDEGRRLGVESDPIGDLTRQRHKAALARALLELPARYREAIVLCDLHELSYETAASALGCAIGTVRSRLHRGRALLAREICGVKRGVISRMPAIKPL